MAEATAARIKFDLVAGTADLEAGLKKGQASLLQFGGTVGKTLDNIGSVATKITSAIGGPVAEFGNILGSASGGPLMATVGVAAALFGTMQLVGNEARRVRLEAAGMGVGVETYQRLSNAAEDVGVEIGQVVAGMDQMKAKIGEAAMSGGKSIFSEMGLDPASLAQMSPEHAFQKLAEAIDKIHNPMLRARVEMEAFGKGGAKLDELIRKAAGGLGDENVMTEYELAQQENMRTGMRTYQTNFRRGAGRIYNSVASLFGGGVSEESIGKAPTRKEILENVAKIYADDKTAETMRAAQIAKVGYGSLAGGSDIRTVAGYSQAISAQWAAMTGKGALDDTNKLLQEIRDDQRIQGQREGQRSTVPVAAGP